MTENVKILQNFLGSKQGRDGKRRDQYRRAPGPRRPNKALFRCEMFLDFDTVALSFLFDKHCPIMK